MGVRRERIFESEVFVFSVVNFDELGNEEALCHRMVNSSKALLRFLDLIRRARNGNRTRRKP